MDALSWESSVMNEDLEVKELPTDGVYVRGTVLEGAGWDYKENHLKEAQPGEMYVRLPLIHFKAVELKKKLTKGYYVCPIYYYPKRTREKYAFIL